MSGDDIQRQLSKLVWGVLATYQHDIVPASVVPPGTQSISVPAAVAEAMMVVYRGEIHQVRAALRRVEAGLPDERDYPDGQINLHEYNRRIMNIIDDERAKFDRLETGMASLQAEMDRGRR